MPFWTRFLSNKKKETPECDNQAIHSRQQSLPISNQRCESETIVDCVLRSDDEGVYSDPEVTSHGSFEAVRCSGNFSGMRVASDDPMGHWGLRFPNGERHLTLSRPPRTVERDSRRFASLDRDYCSRSGPTPSPVRNIRSPSSAFQTPVPKRRFHASNVEHNRDLSQERYHSYASRAPFPDHSFRSMNASDYFPRQPNVSPSTNAMHWSFNNVQELSPMGERPYCNVSPINRQTSVEKVPSRTSLCSAPDQRQLMINSIDDNYRSQLKTIQNKISKVECRKRDLCWEIQSLLTEKHHTNEQIRLLEEDVSYARTQMQGLESNIVALRRAVFEMGKEKLCPSCSPQEARLRSINVRKSTIEFPV